MSNNTERGNGIDRRSFLKNGALAAGALAVGTMSAPKATGRPVPSSGRSNPDGEATRFIHACMTLAYRNYPLERALRGIREAGYEHVAWGTTHRESNGETRPVIAPDATPARAAELARRCRGLGLEPVKMFSMIYPDDEDAVRVLTNRIRQASAAGMEYVLTFGHVDGGDPAVWIRRFRELGPIAADHNVTLVMKQHGGWTTGTGQALAWIVREVNHPNVRLSYDAGNVHWYLEVDPIPDIRTCDDLIFSFCLKDARLLPGKATCGPGFGEIDHYRLFEPVAFTGRTITLAYENIYPPYLGGPSSAEEVDRWARLSREYMEDVIRGLQRV